MISFKPRIPRRSIRPVSFVSRTATIQAAYPSPSRHLNSRLYSRTRNVSNFTTRLSYSTRPTNTSAMATTTPISVDSSTTGLLGLRQTEEVAKKTGELLEKDMARHHVFFNASGFHNHIVHHILALYATGATIPALEQAYRDNTAYQRPASKPTPETVSALSAASPSDLDSVKQYLGNATNYASFLDYFLSEIAKAGGLSGIEQVLNTYLFSGTPRAEDLLVRLHAGFLHPLIHLMYGVEFALPAVVAQALAQAAVHKDTLRDFLLEAERMAREREGGKKMGPISDLYAAVRENQKLATSARFSDDQKITDGVLVRAKEEMLEIVARVKVGEDEVRERTREMYDEALFMTFGSTGFVPEKKEKMDFFFIHHTNSAPFYISLLSLPSITNATKARLLEWKIRFDLVQYTARGAPPLSLAFLDSGSRQKLTSEETFRKLHFLRDDGHVIKLARAVEVYRQASSTWLGRGKTGHFSGEGVDEDIWEKLFGFVVDSAAKEGESSWVRSVGMVEAWKDIPDKDTGK